MTTIYIDDEPYTVDDKGDNLLEVCLSLGFDLPYFCWHPAMHSVGACRQCAVKLFKDENDKRGKIVMSCMTEVKDGLRCSINDPEAVAFRESVIEWLMVNHPNDCPVCDEGGECHLQDMTVMSGHVYRRYRFKKRTYRNQDLGPFVTHEMNRCIQCYRCVRFYRDYAGGRDFDVFGWHDHIYFGRFADGTLENEFSGNLVEICPTGVFDDKTFNRHYTRKWDLQTAPSICVHCGQGCNIIPGERYGTLRRIRNRFNLEVNGYFLCDRGRYGYEFVNDEGRVRGTIVRKMGTGSGVPRRSGNVDIRACLHFSPADGEENSGVIADISRDVSPSAAPIPGPSPAHSSQGKGVTDSPSLPCEERTGEGDSRSRVEKTDPVGGSRQQIGLTEPNNTGAREDARAPVARALDHLAGILREGKVIGIGSPRGSLEANFALRQLVGQGNFYHGVSRHEQLLLRRMVEVMQNAPVPVASLHDVEGSDAVLILGEDILNTAPRLALALRQTALRKPMEEWGDKLRIPMFDDYAVREAAQEERSPLFIATPMATKLDKEAAATYHAAPDDIARLGFAVAAAIDPKAPRVNNFSAATKTLVGQIADALKAAEHPLVIAGLGCGCMASIKAAANIARALGKGSIIFTAPECNSLGLTLMDGDSLDEALQAVRDGKADTVIVLENDLYRRWDAADADALLDGAKHVIVLDHLLNDTVAKAEVVLPAATFAEADGTYVNAEGRAQRFFQAFVPEREVKESWRWLGEMMPLAGRLPANPWETLDEVIAALATAMPVFAAVREVAPPADFRLVGQRVPRQPHRYSGRTAITANVDVFEPPPPVDQDAPLAFSMEGYQGQPPPPLIPRFWAPGWNSVQSVNKFQQEVGGPLRGGDPGRRLIEPAPIGRKTYFTTIPDAFTRRAGEWLIVPAYHIFGSEELSMHSPGIAQLAPQPYLALCPEDAQRLEVQEGWLVEVRIEGRERELPVKIDDSLPAGVSAIPCGLSELPGVLLPAWGKVRLAIHRDVKNE